ncbi:MAG: diguanylate cyclase, partial [Waterburya sp.]
IKFLKQVALQLEIAIKQSELYQHLEQANQELEKLAVLDGLTKIANRRKFDQYLEGEWKRLTRERSPLSLILCDIDYFKLYNDTYGHQAGDRCLQKVAQAISKVIKRPADLVARYGGEEFAVILPNTDAGGAKYLARQIRLQIEALKIPHINSKVDLYVTLSLGVASCIPNGGLGFYALVAAADKGLYQAKELGRNQVALFEMEKS